MIYFVLLALFLMCTFNFDVVNNNVGKRGLYVILCLLLICLAGFRYRVGGDTLNYMFRHNFIPDLFSINLFDEIEGVRGEIGWRLLSSFAKALGDDFYWMQFIQSIIVNVSVFIFFKRYSTHYFTCVLLYYITFYFYLNFEILRESIAISIFLIFGVKYLLSNRFVAYSFTIIIMMLFHTSAVFLFVMPLLLKFSSKNYNYFIICTITYIMGLIISPFFYDFLRGGVPFSFFANQFDAYLEYNYNIFGQIQAYLLYIVLPLLIYKYTKKTSNNFAVFLIVYALIGSLTALFTIFFRFINYFTAILIVQLTAMFIVLLKNKNDRLSLQHGFFFILIIFIFNNIRLFTIVDETKNIRWYSRWYPYYNTFEQREDPDREYMWEKQFEN